jgi:hypothetical protein
LDRQNLAVFVDDFSRAIELEKVKWAEARPAFAVEKQVKPISSRSGMHL